MSELPRIDSEESLEAWLETRPSEDAVFIAHRAAMRVAPIWCAAMNTAWARKRALTVLTPLRLNLISGVARKYPTPEIRDAPLDALFAAARGAPLDARAPLAAAFAAARAPLDALAAAFAAAHAAPLDALDMFWDSIQADVHALIEGKDPSEPSLWPDDNPLASEWRESQPILRDAPGGDFWIDWYQRALDGRPQNWPLLRDVALIDDELWEEGGEALDREINRAVERHRLLEEVRRLKAELAQAGSVTAGAAVPHRGHNHPPELLPNYASEISTSARTIVEQLDAAEEELQQPQLSPSRLRRIGRAILKAVTSVLTYCASLGDDAAKGAAKEVGASVGKWLGRGLVGYMISQTQTFKDLADALVRLADKF